MSVELAGLLGKLHDFAALLRRVLEPAVRASRGSRLLSCSLKDSLAASG